MPDRGAQEQSPQQEPQVPDAHVPAPCSGVARRRAEHPEQGEPANEDKQPAVRREHRCGRRSCPTKRSLRQPAAPRLDRYGRPAQRHRRPDRAAAVSRLRVRRRRGRRPHAGGTGPAAPGTTDPAARTRRAPGAPGRGRSSSGRCDWLSDPGSSSRGSAHCCSPAWRSSTLERTPRACSTCSRLTPAAPAAQPKCPAGRSSAEPIFTSTSAVGPGAAVGNDPDTPAATPWLAG